MLSFLVLRWESRISKHIAPLFYIKGVVWPSLREIDHAAEYLTEHDKIVCSVVRNKMRSRISPNKFGETLADAQYRLRLRIAKMRQHMRGYPIVAHICIERIADGVERASILRNDSNGNEFNRESMTNLAELRVKEVPQVIAPSGAQESSSTYTRRQEETRE
jgi:hypothetical protein